MDFIKDNSEKESSSLKRVLGLASSILLVAGIMIGTGIFKKIAPMAASGLNGNAIIAAWIVAGVVTILGALSVSGLASLTSESGGEYEYLRIIFGNFTAFIFGWSCFTIIGSASVAAMSHLFTQSLHAIFPVPFLESESNVKWLACLTIMLLTGLNILGTRESTLFNNLMTYLKLAGVLFLIAGGLFFSHQGNLLQPSGSIPQPGGWGSFMNVFFAAMLSAFWAYDGWLSVSFISGEIKNPRRNVPIAIVSGISAVMILYVLINWAFLKVMPAEQLGRLNDSQIAASEVSKRLFGEAGNYLISVLILVSAVGSLNGIIITYSRIYYKMSLDGLFFKNASLVHKRYDTPHVALLYAMLVSCLLVFSGTFDTLTDMIVFAGFLFYAMLAYGLILMKKRGLITVGRIGYPYVPVIYMLFSLVLMVNTFITQPAQTLWGVGLIASGIPFYYLFRFTRRNG